MKRILISLLTIGVVAGVGFAATQAFFSDTETSTGNTFTAGAIDLKIDNTSYYNGVASQATTWTLSDLTIQKFFNFTDVKPGDRGEDTISVHVDNNDSWVCADVTLTSNLDNTQTEPEVADDANGLTSGELANRINWIWWADDGDNVLETGETVLPGGNLGQLGVGNTANVALADSQTNIWGNGALPANSTRYLGKAWCFGTLTPAPLTQDGVNNDRTPANTTGGISCNGSAENNAAQSDSLTADVSFRAVQSRNNPNFRCVPPIRIDRTQQGFGDGGWAGWSCPAGTTAVGGGIDSSTNPVGGNGVAAPGALAVDGSTYPVYPHYTFSSGETGYVVHDLADGLGNSITFHIDCQPN